MGLSIIRHKKSEKTYASLKPLTCNILICLTIVLFPDSPAPGKKTQRYRDLSEKIKGERKRGEKERKSETTFYTFVAECFSFFLFFFTIDRSRKQEFALICNNKIIEREVTAIKMSFRLEKACPLSFPPPSPE